jgi:hypothetical protein
MFIERKINLNSHYIDSRFKFSSQSELLVPVD